MVEVNDRDRLLSLCKALSSPARLEIVRMLSANQGMNLNELAERL